jgi:hypothetical protein
MRTQINRANILYFRISQKKEDRPIPAGDLPKNLVGMILSIIILHFYLAFCLGDRMTYSLLF